MRIKNITYISVMTAIMCVIAPFSIYIGPIPISLATFAVYLSGAVLGSSKGAVSVLIYLLLGAVGLPIFSGFEGGFQKIAGVTGGYLIGYIPCSVIIGLMTRKIKKGWAYPVSMVLGTVVCYIFGTAWFSFQTKVGFLSGILVCVLPFLIGDSIKIFAASIISFEMKKRS